MPLCLGVLSLLLTAVFSNDRYHSNFHGIFAGGVGFRSVLNYCDHDSREVVVSPDKYRMKKWNLEYMSQISNRFYLNVQLKKQSVLAPQVHHLAVTVLEQSTVPLNTSPPPYWASFLPFSQAFF